MSPATPTSSSSTTAVTSKKFKRKRKNKGDEQADEVLALVGETLRNRAASNEDSINTFGKHITAKLRILTKETRLMTEKLINDLLFEAEMGNINKNTKIVTLYDKSRNPLEGITNNTVFGYTSNDYDNNYWQPNGSASCPTHQKLVYQNPQSMSISTSPTIQSVNNVSKFFSNYQPNSNDIN